MGAAHSFPRPDLRPSPSPNPARQIFGFSFPFSPKTHYLYPTKENETNPHVKP